MVQCLRMIAEPDVHCGDNDKDINRDSLFEHLDHSYKKFLFILGEARYRAVYVKSSALSL